MFNWVPLVFTLMFAHNVNTNHNPTPELFLFYYCTSANADANNNIVVFFSRSDWNRNHWIADRRLIPIYRDKLLIRFRIYHQMGPIESDNYALATMLILVYWAQIVGLRSILYKVKYQNETTYCSMTLAPFSPASAWVTSPFKCFFDWTWMSFTIELSQTIHINKMAISIT